ncbi:MAG: hypothetical protein ABUS54_14535 [Actinomycetota bacterium]
MGLFRPARTVTAPNGIVWELYVSKTALPPWREGEAGASLGVPNDLWLVFAPFTALWSAIIVPLFRFVALLPIAVVRGRRSRAVRIEAVVSYPAREVLLWTTTDSFLEGVLDEIASGLAEGKVVQPSAAVYSGREEG